MLFNSFEFLVFFPIVVGVYFVIPRRARYIWLLVASYAFYMSWNATYALLLAFSTVVTWVSGLSLDSVNRTGRFFCFGRERGRGRHGGDEAFESASSASFSGRRKAVVAVSLIVNLGILAFFKYFDFVLHNVNVTLSVFSVEPFEKPFDLLLPVGISFYTFQALSYTIDVYRGEVRAERNPFKYALFVSFFPQLVAGPIERSKNLLVQVERVADFKLWNLDRVTRGAILMMWGYFLKMVIADRAAILVNQVYGEHWLYGSSELTLATLLFGVQILCDFAGYSTIAIGAAKVMGFELMENFNTPYFATSIQDFWRRWHISLSTWFRDYLYFPLGGSRVSPLRRYFNILVVFLVSGLWHGAAWTFVVWGFLHGAYQIVGIATRPAKDRLWNALGANRDAFSWKLGKVVVTYLLANFAWIFFRASSIAQAAEIVRSIFTEWNPWVLLDGTVFKLGLAETEFDILICSIVVLVLVDVVRYAKGQNLADFVMRQNLWFRWLVMLGLVGSVFVFGVYGPDSVMADFIYFQF